VTDTSNTFLNIEDFENIQQDKFSDGQIVCEVPKDKLVEFVAYLKSKANYRFDMLVSVSGVDKQDCFEVVYHLYSTIFNKKIVVKVKLEKDKPLVESLCTLYAAANWHERETFDLFGIQFSNHPEMERLLMPKDWIGHPLRKDYVLNDPRLSWNER